MLCEPSSDCIDSLTAGVRAVGEKTAREPFESRTTVPRPPTFMRPKRRNGVERVRMEGLRRRMTIYPMCQFSGSRGYGKFEGYPTTFSGSAGISFAADEAISEVEEDLLKCKAFLVLAIWSFADTVKLV